MNAAAPKASTERSRPRADREQNKGPKMNLAAPKTTTERARPKALAIAAAGRPETKTHVVSPTAPRRRDRDRAQTANETGAGK